MPTIQAGTRITLKNILYLTDFSEFSGAALPFAIVMARNYGATVYALHVLTPPIPEVCHEAIHCDEELAGAEILKVGSQLADVAHDTAVVRGVTLWSVLEPVISHHSIDLIVLGTHGRTGFQKLLLGSAAEEIAWGLSHTQSVRRQRAEEGTQSSYRKRGHCLFRGLSPPRFFFDRPLPQVPKHLYGRRDRIRRNPAAI
jgi:nucleotide-binding universal stress UspA family protein